MNNDKHNAQSVEPATGKLAVLLPGMGAVGTTVIAGVLAARKGLARPIGSLTQFARLGSEPNAPRLRDALPMARLDDIVFGGWDIFEENCYEAAKQAGAGGGAAASGGGGERGELPPATFDTLLSTMATQALFAMGAIPDPRTGQPTLQLDLAKHHIDMLTVIEEKTKGNLSEDEEKQLATTLYELRLRFVQAANAARQK